MQRILAELASNTALLEAAEGDVRMELVGAVHPGGTGFEFVCSLQSAVDVLGEDRGSETVDCERYQVSEKEDEINTNRYRSPGG